MLENILKEFKRKFNHLKGLIVSNSINFEEAKIEVNKFVFALGTIKTSLKKNETAFSQAQLRKVNAFLIEIEELKESLKEIYKDMPKDNVLVEELKVNLPETIHTDAMEEKISIEQ
ncbi:MAG: hypothetical protein IJ415_03965 [Clostridia bacterium]|nr:hypothetical protein [Clostridia bacterium]